jgi:hypothetical protein
MKGPPRSREQEHPCARKVSPWLFCRCTFSPDLPLKSSPSALAPPQHRPQAQLARGGPDRDDTHTHELYEGEGSLTAAEDFLATEARAAALPRTRGLDAARVEGQGWVRLEANAAWGAGLNGCDAASTAARGCFGLVLAADCCLVR